MADGLLAYLDAGRVVQLAAIDSAMAPDTMRALLAEGLDMRRLEAMVGGAAAREFGPRQ